MPEKGKTMDQFIKQINVSRCGKGKIEQVTDSVIEEHVLIIRINGNVVFEIVCTPDQPENLAAGYLFTQKIITDKADVAGIVFDKEALEVRITLCEKAANRLNTIKSESKIKGSSGGLLSPERNPVRAPSKPVDLKISCSEVLHLIRQHHEKSRLFRQTGAVHSCAICSTGNIIRFYEDIGRHNAFDKMAGDIVMNGLETTGGIITASCRLSLEIIQKIAVSGFPMVISNAAPTSSGVKEAESAGITVIGFARDDRFNIYTHDHRVVENGS